MITTSGLNPQTVDLDYKKLRKIDPEVARQTVLTFLNEHGYNISRTASKFGITRVIVYDILKRAESGNLADKPRVPKHQPRKTPIDIELKVIKVRNAMKYGPKNIARYLKESEGISIPVGTIRHILRRAKNNKMLVSGYCTVG